MVALGHLPVLAHKMVSFPYSIFNQIRLLVGGLNKKNFKSTVVELKELCKQYGEDVHLFLLRCLFEEIDFHDAKSGKDQPKIQLLSQEIVDLCSRPNTDPTSRPSFASIVCRALETTAISSDFFAEAAQILQLPLHQQALLALAFAQSVDEKVQIEGLKFFKAKLGELMDPSGPRLPPEVLHELLFFVRTTESLTFRQKAQLAQSLQLLYPDAFKDMSLSALTYNVSGVNSRRTFAASEEETARAISTIQSMCHPSDLLQDAGYSICDSPQRLREVLGQFPNLNEADIAKIIAMMARTHTGLSDDQNSTLADVLHSAIAGPSDKKTKAEDKQKARKDQPQTWNVELFVNTILERYPRLNWLEIYRSFDFPEFYIPDKRGLEVLFESFRTATKGQNLNFPLDIFFGDWKNKKGQLSLVLAVVVHSQLAFEFVNFLNSPRVQQPIDGLVLQVPSKLTGDNLPGPGVSSSPEYTKLYHCWFSLDLMETLLNIGDTDLYPLVKRVFLQPLDRCPEMLLAGLMQVKFRGSLLYEELLGTLIPKFLHPHQNSAPVLQRVWNFNSELIVNWMADLYKGDRLFVVRALEIVTSELREPALTAVLETRSFNFALDLAVLAHQKGALNLEKWLQIRASEHGPPFISSALDFLKDNLVRLEDVAKSDPKPEEQKDRQSLPQLSKVTAATFFRAISPNLLSPDHVQELQKLQNAYCLVCPDISGLIAAATDAPTSSAGAAGNDAISQKANLIFHKIYAEAISLPEVVNMLKKFKSSEHQWEREVYGCMIHNLFDEYRFFHKYPLKELQITGVLFGMLIQHQLVSSFTLGIALRYVLEALRKPEDTKFFKFGMWALSQFKSRLPQWPQYCALVMQIPHLRAAAPDLMRFLDSVMEQQGPNRVAVLTGSTTSGAQQSLEDENTPESNAIKAAIGTDEMARPPRGSDPVVSNVPAPSSSPVSPDIQSQTTSTNPASLKLSDKKEVHGTPSKTKGAVNLDTLLNRQSVNAPPEQIEDKMRIIINSLTKTNMRNKAKELKSILKPEHYPFFVQYMVVKRISTEPNFHKLYLQLCELLQVDGLFKLFVDCTVDNIKLLLGSENILKNTNDRNLLRSFGAWLGMITIGKKKPLLAKKLDLKELILDAYLKKQLLAIIPFVAKVLESCAKNKIFRPPNPWVTAIMRLLREIYDLNIALNVNFEIEVLCKNIGVQLEALKPSTVLRDRIQAQSVPAPVPVNRAPEPPPVDLNPPPVRPPSVGSGEPQEAQPSSIASPGPSATPPPGTITLGVPNLSAGPDQTIIPNLHMHVTIAPSIALFVHYPQLKRCVPSAIDRAIREIITPVVERSVTIACVTTRELILKDFNFEPDESKMRRAAHQMVQSLTSSLALVTCKEPLRVSISNHLGSLLDSSINSSISNDRTLSLIEQACQQVSSDNLDLGCTLIEKAAADRAIKEIDESLAQEYTFRRKFREQPPFQAWSSLAYHQHVSGQSTLPPHLNLAINVRFLSNLPEPLRPKANGLTAPQLRVYEDFLRARAIPSETQNAGQGTPPLQPVPATALSRGSSSTSSFSMASFPSTAGGGATASQSPAPPSTMSPSHSPMHHPQAAHAGVSTFSLGGPESISVAPSYGPGPVPSLSGAQVVDKLSTLLISLEQTVSRYPAGGKDVSWNNLSAALQNLTAPPSDPLMVIAQEINNIITLVHHVLTQHAPQPREREGEKEANVLQAITQKIFKRLFDASRGAMLLEDCLITVLKLLRHHDRGDPPQVVTEVTRLMIIWFAMPANPGGGIEDRKFATHGDLVIRLVRAHLMNILDFETFLTKVLMQVPGVSAMEFMIMLIRSVVIKEQAFPVMDFSRLMDALGQVAQVLQQRRNNKALLDALTGLIEDARLLANTQAQQAMSSGMGDPHMQSLGDSMPSQGLNELKGKVDDDAQLQQAQAAAVSGLTSYSPSVDMNMNSALVAQLDQLQMEENDPPQLRQTIHHILDEWITICVQGTALDNVYAQYLNLLQSHNVLSSEEHTRRFFRIVTELCIESALNSQTIQGDVVLFSYNAVDALAKLIVFLVKFWDTGGGIPGKIALTSTYLTVAADVLLRDYARKKEQFNQRPWLRLFANMVHELNTPDPSLDSNNPHALIAFSMCFHRLRPSRVPGFAFAWMELISHRMFMPKLLLAKNVECSRSFLSLLVDLLTFLEPYLRNCDLTEGIRRLFKGSLRMLLVLLHDFPEFLCDYNFSICEAIPANCVQMRNLVLSAFPHNMRLPDPFTPNLKVDLLPEISQVPRVASDYLAAIEEAHLRPQFESLINNLVNIDPNGRTTQASLAVLAPFLSELHSKLLLPPAESLKAGTRINSRLLGAVTFALGLNGMKMAPMSVNSPSTIAVSPFQDSSLMEIIHQLLLNLDAESRYSVLNTIANQLRYPNAYTHYFSCVLLYIFVQSKDEAIKEQATRVLLERLIAQRPHPWGLLITFIELLKNQRYQFWEQPFTRSSPEITRLFESVARSCMPSQKGSVGDGQGVEGM